MTDHPFDEIAVEQIARHMAEVAGFKSHDWAPFRTRANLALSAAFKSATERGMARGDLGHLGGSGHWHIGFNSGEGCFPVTIIRHKELT